MAGEKYEYGIDFDAIEAIDIHTHVEADDHGHHAYDDELIAATKQYFKLDSELTTVDSVAEHYRQRNTAAVVFTIDSQTVSGHPPNSVENLIEGATRNNDVLIPFGTVDPLTGDRAVHGVHRQVELGVKGFKFHPSLQGFEPNDRAYYPIYSAIAEAGRACAVPHRPDRHRLRAAGRPRRQAEVLRPDAARRRGCRLPRADDRDGTPAVPWVDAQISIATHKANVYIDLSGWSPKYFPPQLVRAANRQLRTKVLFGTDYPYIELDRWRRDFETLDMKPEVLPLIFKDNALRVLGVTSARRGEVANRGSTCRRWISDIGLLGALPFAQGVQQFPVRADEVGGVPGAELASRRGCSRTGLPGRVMAITRVWVDRSAILMPSRSLPSCTSTPPTMNER